jgi:hypothetical protein
LNEIIKKEARQRHLNSQNHNPFPATGGRRDLRAFGEFLGVSVYALAK